MEARLTCAGEEMQELKQFACDCEEFFADCKTRVFARRHTFLELAWVTEGTIGQLASKDL